MPNEWMPKLTKGLNKKKKGVRNKKNLIEVTWNNINLEIPVALCITH